MRFHVLSEHELCEEEASSEHAGCLRLRFVAATVAAAAAGAQSVR